MGNITIKDKTFRPYITAKQLESIVDRVADEINRDIEGKKPIFLATLNGAFMFAADLLKRIKNTDCQISFIKISSYAGTETTGNAKELIGLNDADVDFQAMTIKVTGKRNKQRIIPFDQALKETLQAYVAKRNDEVEGGCEALFVRPTGERLYPQLVERIVKKGLSRVVTMKKRSAHVLRHSFATAMLNHEAELGAIKELLGHESLATTEIYTHTTFEELKKVYNQAHPRA